MGWVDVRLTERFGSWELFPFRLNGSPDSTYTPLTLV